jgi:hypothetical protein
VAAPQLVAAYINLLERDFQSSGNPTKFLLLQLDLALVGSRRQPIAKFLVRCGVHGCSPGVRCFGWLASRTSISSWRPYAGSGLAARLFPREQNQTCGEVVKWWQVAMRPHLTKRKPKETAMNDHHNVEVSPVELTDDELDTVSGSDKTSVQVESTIMQNMMDMTTAIIKNLH